jgi:TetR/AcrR family transcriptional regulator, cholesterol catabolism regulator
VLFRRIAVYVSLENMGLPKVSAVQQQKERSPAFEARRLDLLRQVAIAFADDGYNQTSVGSLADRLGVSKPVLYYYAKNKDDLLYQSMKIAVDEIMVGLDRANTLKMCGAQKLESFFYTYTKTMCGDFGRCIAMVDYRALSEGPRAKIIVHRSDIENGVRRIIEEGQADGSIVDRDVKLTVRALFGAFNGIPAWFDNSGELTLSAVVESYVDIFTNGIGRPTQGQSGRT